jgi:succinyl-CoA synthetase beta subunit
VAIKVVSSQILHKSDIGAVRLHVQGPGTASAAFDEVVHAASMAGAVADGALVSPMRTSGIELLVGIVRDPDWGPMLAVGMGGVYVEILDDSVLTPLPVSRDRVMSLLLNLRGAPLLMGARGRPKTDIASLADVIVTISELAMSLGDKLTSLEVNPLLVDGDRIEALDALLEWSSM